MDNQKPILICICNPAGGIGKSTATALLSLSLAYLDIGNVLCLDLHEQLNASYMLGLSQEYLLKTKECSLKLRDCMESPIGEYIVTSTNLGNSNLDVLSYYNFDFLLTRELYATGESNFDDILYQIQKLNKYKYIISDLGRGDSVIQKQNMLFADIIIVPLVNTKYALSGLETVYKNLCRMNENRRLNANLSSKKVYLFYCKGNRNSNDLQVYMNNSLSKIRGLFKQNLNIDLNIIRSVIPYTTRINTTFNSKFFIDKSTKDIAQSYLLAANELLSD